jgi:competence protein ComEC
MRRRRLFKILSALLILTCLLIGFTLYSQADRQNLEVDFLNVGQGDAILIKTPYEQNILIDGGPDNSVLSELGKNLAFFDKNIDLVILTHPHSDHVTGLVEVLRRYKVKKVLMTGVLHTAPYYSTFLDEIRKQNIPTEVVKGPENINLGEGLDIKILYPFSDLSGQKSDNLNNTSIVAKLIYKDNSFLFEGDAGKEVEEAMLVNKIDLKSNVLKVAHHGSKNATSQEFLNAVLPQIAVISVGKNDYGHPSQITIDRLLQNYIKILRTDLVGTIKITSDGKQIEIKNRDYFSPDCARLMRLK